MFVRCHWPPPLRQWRPPGDAGSHRSLHQLTLAQQPPSVAASNLPATVCCCGNCTRKTNHCAAALRAQVPSLGLRPERRAPAAGMQQPEVGPNPPVAFPDYVVADASCFIAGSEYHEYVSTRFSPQSTRQLTYIMLLSLARAPAQFPARPAYAHCWLSRRNACRQPTRPPY